MVTQNKSTTITTKNDNNDQQQRKPKPENQQQSCLKTKPNDAYVGNKPEKFWILVTTHYLESPLSLNIATFPFISIFIVSIEGSEGGANLILVERISDLKKKKGNCDSGTINEHGGSLDKDWWMWWLLEIENQRQARRLGVVVMSSVYKWKRKEKEKERETNATRVSFLWTSECHVGLDSSEPNFGQKSNTLWICEEKKQTKHFEGTKNKFYPFG